MRKFVLSLVAATLLALSPLASAQQGGGQGGGGGSGGNIPGPTGTGQCFISTASGPGNWTWGSCSGSSSLAFSSLTAGVNTTGPLTMGSGSTFNTAAGSTIDFSLTAPTAFKLPVIAGAATSANGQVGYDTTNKNWHAFGNAVDNFILLAPIAGTYNNNDCAKFSVATGTVTITSAGAACGAGGGAGNVISVPTPLAGDAAYWTDATHIQGITPTGTAAPVRANTPTLVTPILGVATATSINKVAITAPATGSTITVNDGKTLAVSNTLTFTGTDSSSIAFGAGGTVTYTTNNLSVFASTTSAQLAGVLSDEISTTGSAKSVFAVSFQGTDTALMTAGTVSGTSVILCTDANGGATTVSCPATGNTTSTSLISNTIPKANGANSIINSSITDDGTTVSISDTGGLSITSAAAGIVSLGQGTGQGTGTNAIGVTAGTSVTSYNLILPGSPGNGFLKVSNSVNQTGCVATGTLLCGVFTNVDLAADVGATILTVPNGGTGLATMTAHGVVVAEGTSVPVFKVGGAGTLMSGQGASSDPLFTASPVLGSSGAAVTGSLGYSGSTSGTVTTTVQNAAGTYNFNFPTTAGNAGEVLTSQAGGSTAQTWTRFFATNPQTTTYQVVAADFLNCETIPVASGTFTITLVASGTQPVAGQCIDVINYGSGVVTVARSGQNINGAAANLTLSAGSASAPTGVHVVSDGTNYVAQAMGSGGGGSGTINNASQYSGTYYSAAGTTNTLSGIAAPTTPSGVPQYWTSTNVAGSAAAPAWVLAGVAGRSVSGTSDTIVVADRAGWITYSSASATAITLPQAGSTGFAGNFVIGIKATGAGTLTITPTTSTIDGAATLVITQGQNCTITSLDNTNYVSRCAGGQGTFTAPLVYTASANGGATTCPTCVVASSPGVGIGHFAGSTQTQTSSLIVNADITASTIDLTTKVTGVLPLANMTQLFVTNAQTSTYQVLAADFADCKTIPVASGTFTITLVASGTQPVSGQCVDVINYGSGVVTVARSGQNINGAAANLTLAAGSSSAPNGVHVVSDGTNYVAQTISASGTGTVTNIATTSPITGGPITNTGTIACATCTTSTTPGVGIAHFAGGTQNQTSSLIVNADITATTIDLTTKVTGVLPLANMSQLFVVNSQTTTYQVLAADFTACKTISVPSGTFTVTLVASGTQPASGQCVDVINYGSGVVTIARSGQNINGAAANLTLAAGSASAPIGVHVVSDGTNYVAQTVGGGAGAVSSVFTRTGAVVAVSGDYTLDLIGNPAADKTFTSAIGSTTGVTFSGTAPASVATATGTNASSIFNVTGVTGGADSNATGTAGIGSSPTIASGAGGAGTSTNTVGGAGGTVNVTTGAGGASAGTGVNSNGGDVLVTLGAPGTGGSGTAGKQGTLQIVGGAFAGFDYFTQGTVNTTLTSDIPANSIIEQAPTSVTAYAITKPGVAPNYASIKTTDGCASSVCTESFKSAPVVLTVASDFTTAANTSLQTITGLTKTMPVSLATNVVFHCAINYSQGTAAAAVAFGIQGATTAPTRIEANGTNFTNTTAETTGTLDALTTTTATNIVSATPSAITTIWKAVLDGTLEAPSNATPTVLNFLVSTATSGDAVTVKRGSYCKLDYQ